MKVLVVNVGSSSLKFKLFEFGARGKAAVLGAGKIAGIFQNRSTFQFSSVKGESQGEASFPDYDHGIKRVTEFLTGQGKGLLSSLDELGAVGFKTVHCGDRWGAQLLNNEILAQMDEFSSVAPAHNPAYLEAIRSFRRELPKTPLVGLFEPTFHRTMPDEARYYAIPREWSEKLGIKHYGFHGASHWFIAERVAELMKKKKQRLISCHLGGSSSITAIKDGHSIDTSMGFSPQSGLPQSTRPGDLDPYAVLFLMEKLGMGRQELERELSRHAGLLALSELSGEFSLIEHAAKRGNQQARFALHYFAYHCKKYIGAYYAILGGVDALVFTGGIGENSPTIRKLICEGLEHLGILLDKKKNQALKKEGRIQAKGAKTKIMVVPTDEELIVGREVHRVVKAMKVAK